MKAGSKAVLEFTEMMESLTGTGLSLRDSLEIIAAAGTGNVSGRTGAEKASAPRAGAAVLAARILSGIERSSSFAAAVGRMDVFPPIYRGMIALGDKTGSVEKIFPRLAVFLRERRAMCDKTAAALIYPALVLFVALAGSAGLAVFVLPKLEDIFSAFGRDAGEVVSRNISAIKSAAKWLGAGIAALSAAFLALMLAGSLKEEAAELRDRIILKIPGAGKFIIVRETLNFSFAMETLVSGGISVEAGLREAAAVISNRHYRRAVGRVIQAVMGGGGLYAAFSGTGVFPQYFCRWIALGENSGKSGEIFSRIRVWFQNEAEKQMGRFLLLVEPALIVLVGILVLILVSAVVLPLFQAYENLV